VPAKEENQDTKQDEDTFACVCVCIYIFVLCCKNTHTVQIDGSVDVLIQMDGWMDGRMDRSIDRFDR
jgi:hypothetical protein